MSIALIGQAASNSAVSPVTVTYNSTPGSLLVAMCARNSAGDVYTGITDSAGNSWTLATAAPAAGSSVGRRMELWYCVNANAITSFSASFTGIAPAYVSLYEFSGVAATGAFDAAFSKFQSQSTAPTAAAVTPSEANELAIGAIRANGGSVQTYTLTSPGWISCTVPGIDNNGVAYYVGPAANSPLGPTWALAVAAGSGSATAAFKAAPAPAGAVKYWDGSNWVEANPGAPIKYWDGSNWVTPPPGKVKYWNGSTWETVL